MKKTIRVYEVRPQSCVKVGNFETREEVIDCIKSDYPYPHDTTFVYTVVDPEDAVASSMVMLFLLD